MSNVQSKPTAWSPQQRAFIDWAITGKGSCVLEAVAGAGKTTTLLEAAEKMPGQVAIMAYNKKIADEIKGKLAARGCDYRKAQSGTVHSFGFSAYRKAFPDVRVDGNKVANIVDAMLAPDEAGWKSAIIGLVSLAKQSALGVVGRIDDAAAFMDIADHHELFDDIEDEAFDPMRPVRIAIAALKASNANTTVIDFDDMVYMPLVYQLRFWQFDVVMVDEAQDTNAARRALVRAALKRGGRVIAVGDSRQAIYGFTGADSDSLDLIAADFNCIRLPLTTTYRCPQAVVSFAQQWVSHITAAATAPVGSVSEIDAVTFLTDYVDANRLNGSTAVLCRNTKPLVAFAFRLIAMDVACRVEGREIGEGLKKLASKWKSVKTTSALRARLEKYLDRETTKNLSAGKESRMQAIEDQVATLMIIIDRCEQAGQTRVSDVDARIDALFSDDVSGVLTLSTIHKSKGREWQTVFWLDRANTCPSKWARKAWQQVQEENLCYVAATRAQNALIELPDMSNFKRPQIAIAA